MDGTQLDIQIDTTAKKIQSEGGCMLFVYFDKEEVTIRIAGNLKTLSDVLKQSMEHDVRLASVVFTAVGSLVDK